jgi:hypothetical protein
MSTSGETEQRHDADPAIMNGTTAGAARTLLRSLPRPRPLALLPALAAVAAAFGAAAFFNARRSIPASRAGKSMAPKHKPKNMLRYYGITMLINALEREATRKMVLAALKWARQRA